MANGLLDSLVGVKIENKNISEQPPNQKNPQKINNSDTNSSVTDIKSTNALLESLIGGQAATNIETTQENKEKYISYRQNIYLEPHKKTGGELLSNTVGTVIYNTKIKQNTYEKTTEQIKPSVPKKIVYLSGQHFPNLTEKYNLSYCATCSDPQSFKNHTNYLNNKSNPNLSKYLGICYTWGGGKGTNPGFDCSGFVQNFYNETLGINIGRTTKEQITKSKNWGNIVNQGELNGKTPNFEQMQQGDLMYFYNANNTVVHVAIYVGKNPQTGKQMFIHSKGGQNKQDCVQLSPYEYFQNTQSKYQTIRIEGMTEQKFKHLGDNINFVHLDDEKKVKHLCSGLAEKYSNLPTVKPKRYSNLTEQTPHQINTGSTNTYKPS